MIAVSAGALNVSDIGSPLGVAAIFVVLFAASFFFSGTETAFFSLQELERRRIAEGTTPTDRRIHALLERRTGLITTILMGNETANVAIAATATAVIASLVPSAPWLTIVIVTPCLVLFSEITPKVLAFRLNRRWTQLSVWPITILYYLLAPVRFFITALVRGLARFAGVTAHHPSRQLGEEEFLDLVERSAEGGSVDEDARDIIEAVFELDDLPVSRLMTPKPDVFALPVDTPWDALLLHCRDAQFSRVPIYEGSIDNIIGVLLVKDLLRCRARPFTHPEELRALLLEPLFVPASKPADEMMRTMIRRRIHMAFVADEHLTLMGLVSLDDLIIELVGELGDNASQEHIPVIASDDVITVRATMDVDDFAEHTEISLPEGRYHTIGGFIFHTLGRVPRVGDEVSLDQHIFQVLEMEGRRISTIRVRFTGPTNQEATA